MLGEVMAACRSRAGRGLTMIELMVGIAIVAILLALAVPSLRLFMMQQRLKATASELLADIQAARSTALGQVDDLVTVTFGANPSTSCYAVVSHLPPFTNCNCLNPANSVCSNPLAKYPAMRRVSITSSTGIAFAATGDLFFQAGNGLIFAFAPNLPSGQSITVTANPGGQLMVTVNAAGVPRICVPAGSSVSGFAPC